VSRWRSLTFSLASLNFCGVALYLHSDRTGSATYCAVLGSIEVGLGLWNGK